MSDNLSQIKKINILGCGWLGFPLAKHLHNRGYEIAGSTTSSTKLPLLQGAGISPFLIDLTTEKSLDSDFFQCDCLIITIPPRGEPRAFERMIKQLSVAIQKHPPEQVIYTSSTSVYPDLDRTVREEDASYDSRSRSGTSLLHIEDILATAIEDRFVALRLGGLWGEDRHPVNHLAGKRNLAGGNHPVNLIHLDDCIGVITEIIQQGIRGIRVNACSPEHPTRKDYYTRVALQYSLEPPTFVDTPNGYKTVSSDLLSSLINYQFKVSL
jgi:nucleoside-diphosphate-sugar epimerase